MTLNLPKIKQTTILNLNSNDNEHTGPLKWHRWTSNIGANIKFPPHLLCPVKIWNNPNHYTLKAVSPRPSPSLVLQLGKCAGPGEATVQVAILLQNRFWFSIVQKEVTCHQCWQFLKISALSMFGFYFTPLKQGSIWIRPVSISASMRSCLVFRIK